MELYEKIIAAGLLSTAILQILALRQIAVVHQVINSRLDRWLKIEREQGNAAGREEERKETQEKGNVPIKLIIISAAVVALSGCSSTNITKLVGALAKDPATVAVSVQSVYGTVYILRTGNTNQQIILGPISVK